MSKKYIIIIIIFLTVLTAAGVANHYFSSFKKASISLEKPGISAQVYKRDPHSEESNNDIKVTTLTTSQTISLEAGKYYVIPKGDKVDESQISFTIIDKDISVKVDPSYSNKYLQSLLPEELSTIKSILTAKYPAIVNYTIQQGKLYEDGSWYATTLTQKVAPQDSGDVYRTVLHKTNGTWEVAAVPQLVLTVPDNKAIPEVILRDINREAGN